MSYLYTASIQGIQSYIFKTGKLREIAGASEIVNNITENIIKDILSNEYRQEQLVRAAAGNVVYICNDEKVGKKLVRELPKKVFENSGGEITVSQALVKYGDEDKKLSWALREANKILKTQRNKNNLQGGFGFMGIERERRTGDAAVVIFEKEVAIGEATKYKLENKDGREKNKLSKIVTGNSELKDKNIPYDFKDLVKEGNDQWMAVIHADGNGLGNLIQNLFKEQQSDQEVQEQYRNFSKALDDANKAAVKTAYKALNIDKDIEKIPIRPIILGGDDLTVIIRADLAFDFTVEFLKEFEEQTKKEGLKGGLSACAGIAYIKSSYPIYYGLHLAETLCKDAKRMVKKGKTQNFESALAFYKVKESFIDNFDSLIERTMKINPSQEDEVNFYYGPYYLTDKDSKKNSVPQMYKMLEVLNKDSDDKISTSNLRKWIGELYKDRSTANLLMGRMIANNPKLVDQLDLKNAIDSNKKTIIHDLLTLNSFKN